MNWALIAIIGSCCFLFSALGICMNKQVRRKKSCSITFFPIQTITLSMATVTDRSVHCINWGYSLERYNVVEYYVRFLAVDGQETELQVPQGLYENVRVGQCDMLAYRGDKILDFGGFLSPTPPIQAG